MQCEYCGCQMDSVDQFCPGCGKAPQKREAEEPELMAIWEPVAVSKPVESKAENAETFSQTAAPIPPPPPLRATSPTAAPPPVPKTVGVAPRSFTPGLAGPPSGKATGSLVCGLLGLVIGLLGIVAIILGHMALSEIKKSAGRIGGRGQAIAGLVLGYIEVGLTLLVLLLVLAIPGLMLLSGRGRAGTANETAAISALRTLNSAEAAYTDQNPIAGYTCDLQKLKTSGTLDPAIVNGRGSGYVFEVSGCLASSSGMVQLYQATAVPAQPGRGKRAFCTDQSGIIRFDAGGSASDCFATGTPVGQ